MSRHLAKLFDSLCKLKFRLDEEEKPLKFGLGMFSKEDEYVDFDQECDLSGQVSAGGHVQGDSGRPRSGCRRKPLVLWQGCRRGHPSP